MREGRLERSLALAHVPAFHLLSPRTRRTVRAASSAPAPPPNRFPDALRRDDEDSRPSPVRGRRRTTRYRRYGTADCPRPPCPRAIGRARTCSTRDSPRNRARNRAASPRSRARPPPRLASPPRRCPPLRHRPRPEVPRSRHRRRRRSPAPRRERAPQAPGSSTSRLRSQSPPTPRSPPTETAKPAEAGSNPTPPSPRTNRGHAPRFAQPKAAPPKPAR